MSDKCPYCRCLYTAENPKTDDHVFGGKLGGRVRVSACQRCNNDRFGSAVEGELQRAGTLLSFMKHLAGDAGKRVKGTIGPDKRPVEIDLMNKTLRSTKPVTRHGDGRYTFEGSPKQVRAQLERAAPKLGLTAVQIEKLLASATSVDVADGSVNTVLAYDLGLATKLGAKALLGSLVVARGETAADSQLAHSLRSIALGDEARFKVAGDEPLVTVKNFAASAGAAIAEGCNAAVFVTAFKGKTIAYLLVEGQPLPPFGLVVGGEVPNGDPISTVVEDARGGVRVLGIADLMKEAAAPEAGHPGDDAATPRPTKDRNKPRPGSS